MSVKPTKAQLEYYVSAKPGAKESPGYFTDGGDFVRGPHYSAKLGNKFVGMLTPFYKDGWYVSRASALEGARLFQEKCQELLDAGEYADAPEPPKEQT